MSIFFEGYFLTLSLSSIKKSPSIRNKIITPPTRFRNDGSPANAAFADQYRKYFLSDARKMLLIVTARKCTWISRERSKTRIKFREITRPRSLKEVHVHVSRGNSPSLCSWWGTVHRPRGAPSRKRYSLASTRATAPGSSIPRRTPAHCRTSGLAPPEKVNVNLSSTPWRSSGH